MIREDKILKQSIRRLSIPDKVIEKLEKNNVKIIADLCSKSKTNLKKLDLQQHEIDNVQIQLQLEGLNLKGGL